MSDHTFKIFCDFDGTIAVNDIGNHFYRFFGDSIICDEAVEKWEKGIISSIECLSTECSTIKDLTIEKAHKFIDEQKIDNTFLPFVEFCRESDIEITVLSDGLDLYKERLFKNHGINVKYFSNSIDIKSDGTAEMIYPYIDSECKKCANCKRNHVLNQSGDDEITIYIGDGLSDACPIEFCDYIFAKNQLLLHCEKNRISFSPFKNFDDVREAIEKLLTKKRIKKRHQAELKRREIYMMEP
ncbi:MAG: HAD-IB family phosphatase [Ignavibacteria bacterium]|nr:HAD-IB family phosphatase [Ignavibacteria bacterium]